MARPDKVAQVAEVARRLEEANATVLTEYRGLTVSELADLRRRLREQDAEYKVVKNTLTRLAARDAGVELPDEVLTGPTAVTFCAGDPVAAAKVLKTFQKEHPELQIKAGIVEGSLLDGDETAKLADLASREELLAQVAGMLGTLMAAPARLAQANLDKLARVLGAYRDKRDDGSEPAEVAEEAMATAESDDAVTAEADQDATDVATGEDDTTTAADDAQTDDAATAEEATPAADSDDAEADAEGDDAKADATPEAASES